MLVGDYNVHMENQDSDSEAKKFVETLDVFDLHQLVDGPTHELNGTLDLILTQSKTCVYGIEIEEECLRSDHNPIS